MCHFLKPLKLTQELSQKMSYSCELWYGSCFYDAYSGTAKKRRRNRRYRRKPPSAADFFFCHFSLNYTFLNHLSPTYFFFKNYPYICTEHLWFFWLKSKIFEILQVSKENVREIFLKKISWAQMIQKCIIQREMAKKNSVADGGFRR